MAYVLDDVVLLVLPVDPSGMPAGEQGRQITEENADAISWSGDAARCSTSPTAGCAA